MKCIVCGNKTKVWESTTNGVGTFRKIKCTKCSARFCTEEKIIDDYDEDLRAILTVFYQTENRKKKKRKNELSNLR